jgi:type I restriction-modification system DNA methylase subunit
MVPGLFKDNRKMPQNAGIEQLRELVSLFSANIAQYKGGQYDEANARADFIDKFFTLLGWDIANNQGFSESYREVVREDRVTVDGSKKAPDYSFRIGGARKFFVEAKKPSVNIKDAAESAYQVRRYAYSAGLPVSILTNFAEFAVYDTRVKPNRNDKASVARVFYCTFDQYEKQFDFIGNTFSKNAILKGSFDRYIGGNKNKKGTSEVDTEILALIEEWRLDLAKNIAKNNSGISIYNINTAVQRIIDRIMFIRIAEDKGIEEANILLSVAKSQRIYEKLILIFAKANTKYNSGLFAGVDWINKVSIDDKVLSNIIINLYYPECPYEFSVLPVEILGSIYERFLGKTIRFRAVKGDTHTAVIEEKPEVKRAGGVFYTPQYIVDYIVQNTVGEKIKDKTPQEISGVRICDPSCGSGSFLVGAYQYLLDYHLDYYTQAKNVTAALKGAKIYEAAYRSYNLTIAEKQRILKNSIFGVDIDRQAVEVTKLSLYLKLLENESGESTGELFKYSDMTLLLSLEENIKCGNSLIGTDFYAQTELELTDDDRIKVNCFDWEKEFPSIFKAGGFDAVIGNPPYFNIQTLGAGSEIALYIQKKYADIWQDKSDILFYFLAEAMRLSKGNIGFILSNAFLFSDKAQRLRNKIVDDGRLAKIVNFEQYQVFGGASVTTGIFIFLSEHSGIQAAVLKDKTYSVEDLREYINRKANYFKVKFEKDAVFALVDSRTVKINKKIDGNHPLLQDICLVGKGMETAADDVFLFDKYPRKFPKRFIKRRITGKDIERYFISDAGEYVLYFEDVKNFKDLPVSIQNHLNENRKALKGRADKKRRPTAPWWNYTFALHREYYHLPKLYCSSRCSFGNTFCYDDGFDCLGFSNVTVVFGTNENFSLKYILALLNSKALTYRYRSIGKQTGGGSFEYFTNGVGKLPIPALDLSVKADKIKHDKIVSFVDKILELKQREAAEKNPQLKTMVSRHIDGVDKAIDTAVYELYGLTEDEIAAVEGV